MKKLIPTAFACSAVLPLIQGCGSTDTVATTNLQKQDDKNPPQIEIPDSADHLVVDKNKCIGCTGCAVRDPQHFGINTDPETDRQIAVVLRETNLDSPKLFAAIQTCPAGAITIGKK